MSNKRNKNANSVQDINKNNTETSKIEDSIFAKQKDLFKEIQNTLEDGSYREKEETSAVQEVDEGADAQVFTEGHSKSIKIKKKKEKKPYEHTTWSHKMRVLGVLLVVGIFTGSGLGVWYFNSQLRTNFNPFDFKAEDYIQSVSETFQANNINATEADKLNWIGIAQANGLTPADVTPADNFILAAHNLSFASSYIVDGSGFVNATAFGVPAKQSIQSRKKYNGSYYTFESISPSNFKKLGLPDIVLCDKYDGSNMLSLYTSSDLTPEYGDWSLSEKMSVENYELQNGSLPNELTPYIISAKTVSSETNTKESIEYNEADGTYTFTMSLDKQTSVINYSKQVRRTGGLSGYPEFEYVNFTVTIDENWNLKSFTIQEKYYALKMGAKANCNGVLNYTVTINNDVQMPV